MPFRLPAGGRAGYAGRVGMRVGRYETICPIASGGMATVHLARAVGVGGFERLVAIKVMHEHIAKEPDFVAMFLDEARLAARIRHPNVVPTIDVQQTDDGVFLVMEFIEGPSLRRMLRKLEQQQESLPVELAVRVVAETLSGLHAAHELKGPDGALLNLVHRDVSPANVLVGADGIVRLTDFGVARAEARLSSTRGGQLKGKIPYMPPEQIMGEPLDRRTDVYAAGLVLWEALVGRRAIVASNDGELVHRIVSGAIDPPRRHRPELPEPIEQACLKALAMKPDDRYATAAEFADALEDAAEASGLLLASSRRVGAYVAELGVHVTSEELIADAQAGGSGVRAAREGGRGAAEGTADYSVASPASVPSGAEEAPASASRSELQRGSVSTATAATISAARSPEELALAKRSTVSLRVGFIAGTVVLLGGAAFWLATSAGPGAAKAPADETAADTSSAETTTAAASTATSGASVAPTDTAVAAPAPPSATASPSASAPATAAAAPPPPRPVPRPPSKPRPLPAKPPPAAPKSTSAAGYRPPGL